MSLLPLHYDCDRSAERFAVTDAHASLLAAIQQARSTPSTQDLPVLVCGPPRSGKTHFGNWWQHHDALRGQPARVWDITPQQWETALTDDGAAKTLIATLDQWKTPARHQRLILAPISLAHLVGGADIAPSPLPRWPELRSRLLTLPHGSMPAADDALCMAVARKVARDRGLDVEAQPFQGFVEVLVRNTRRRIDAIEDRVIAFHAFAQERSLSPSTHSFAAYARATAVTADL